MDRIDQYNHDYQTNIERADRLRATMWADHDKVVSALTGVELTHEDARQIAMLKSLSDHGHPALLQQAVQTFVSGFDDTLFEHCEDEA